MENQSECRYQVRIGSDAVAQECDARAFRVIGSQDGPDGLPHLDRAGRRLVEGRLIGTAERLDAVVDRSRDMRCVHRPPGHGHDASDDREQVLYAMAHLARHRLGMLAVRSSRMHVRDVPLAAEIVDEPVVVVVDRTEMQGTPERRAVLAVTQKLDHHDLLLVERGPDLRDLFWISVGALEKAAVLSDDFIFVVAGQIAKRAIGEDDRLPLGMGIGQADRYACLCHRLLEEHAGSARKRLRPVPVTKPLGAVVVRPAGLAGLPRSIVCFVHIV